jgi:hypothetical protein
MRNYPAGPIPKLERHRSTPPRNLRQKRVSPRAAATATEPIRRRILPVPVIAFLISLQLPWVISLGSVGIFPYRIVLLAVLPICITRWISGKAGPIRLSDIAFILFCIWCTISLMVVHGIGYALQPAGAIWVETLGAYFLGRCYVRDEHVFRGIVAALFLCVVVVLPFALFETLTGRDILLDAFGTIFPTYQEANMPPRWGLERVQANVLHPILFGVVVGSILSMTHLVLGYGQRPVRRWLKSGIVLFTAFLSLSAGPLTAAVAQIGLLSWNWLMRDFRKKWILLIGTFFAATAFISLFATRSPAAILIGYFAFDESSAYIRLLTWEYGTRSILDHPLFGTGLGDWDRPSWLTPSIDMYWIVDSVRHGLPAGFFLMLAFVSMVLQVSLKKGLDDRMNAYRCGYVIGMAGFFFAGWAVYLWGTAYVLFLFLLGNGAWILDHAEAVPRNRRALPRQTGAEA